MEERDYREGHETGRQVNEEYIKTMCEKMPKKYALEHLELATQKQNQNQIE